MYKTDTKIKQRDEERQLFLLQRWESNNYYIRSFLHAPILFLVTVFSALLVVHSNNNH